MTTRSDRRGLIRRATLDRGSEPFTLAIYSGGELPPASLWEGAYVYVTDDIGGSTPAFSDGVSWRRVSDRSIIAPLVAAALYGVAGAAGSLEGAAGSLARGAGVALGTLGGASYVGGALSGAGAAVATLATPPKVPADLSGAGSAAGTLTGAARAAGALSSAGTAAGVCALTGATA